MSGDFRSRVPYGSTHGKLSFADCWPLGGHITRGIIPSVSGGLSAAMDTYMATQLPTGADRGAVRGLQMGVVPYIMYGETLFRCGCRPRVSYRQTKSTNRFGDHKRCPRCLPRLSRCCPSAVRARPSRYREEAAVADQTPADTRE